MGRLGNTVDRMLAVFGYRLEPVGPRVFDAAVDSMIALEKSVKFRPFVVRMPVARLRALHWYVPGPRHPYVAALLAYREVGATAYAESPLRSFYETATPLDAAAALGLEPADAPGFCAIDARAMTLPWSVSSPAQTLARHLAAERAESVACGRPLDAADGTKFFGPVSTAKGELQLRRLIGVYETVRSAGWRRNDDTDGDVRARLLLGDDGEWCAHVWTGQHRVAAAAALGLTEIPVRIAWPPVRRADVHRWQQVVRARMSPAGAITVFDRILNAAPLWRVPSLTSADRIP